MITFDDLLNSTLQMGTYQKRALCVVSLIDFTDGIEKIFIGTLLSVLTYEWKLQESQIKLLASTYFVGIIMGTIFCAFFADQLGRKRTLLYSSMGGFLLILWKSLAYSFEEMVFLRLCFGFIFGTTIPLSNIVISEIVPARMRGSIMIVVAVIFIMGKIYCTLLCLIFLDDFNTGHWRLFLAWNSVPLLLCTLGCLFLLRESPRFLLSQKKFDEAFYEIEMIDFINNPGRNKIRNLVLYDQKDGLTQNEYQISHGCEISVFDLFSPLYLGITLRLWCIFMLTSIFETTMYILMPFWLNKGKRGLYWMLWLMVSELLASLSMVNVIDRREWIGGRNRLVMMVAGCMCVISVMIYLSGELMLMSVLQFLLRILFSSEMIIMQESFTTQYRSMGVGLTQTMGKLMGVVSPYFIFDLYYYDPLSPFLLYGFLMCAIVGLVYTFPIDMTSLNLDTFVKNDQQQQGYIELQ